MRWMTSGSVRMYGVNYSPQQAVNTDGWSPAQVHHQVYLGNIIPDTRINAPYYEYSEGGGWSNERADFIPSTYPGRVTFTGPWSRQVMYMAITPVRHRNSTGDVAIRMELRRGAVQGAGDLVRSFGVYYHRGTLWESLTMVGLSDQLDIGEPYNLGIAIRCDAGGGDVGGSRIWAVPLAE